MTRQPIEKKHFYYILVTTEIEVELDTDYKLLSDSYSFEIRALPIFLSTHSWWPIFSFSIYTDIALSNILL
jgi:hypothetical protein